VQRQCPLLRRIEATVARQGDELAAIRRCVETRPAKPPENLLALGEDEITVAQAAPIAGVDKQSIRNWCRRHGIGRYDVGRAQWVVSRSRLMDYVERRFGIKS
jgi:hypothetical protein